MGVRQVAAAHYREQASLAKRVAARIGRLWRRVVPQDIAGSWQAQLPEAALVVTAGQLAAAGRADGYTARILGAGDDGPLRVEPLALAGVASDGRGLASLLYQPVITALAGIRDGATVDRALSAAALDLDMIVRTQVADAGRVADGVATTTHGVDGYIRLVQPGACSRCIILAGVFYEWNTGFLRHPSCMCQHVPADADLPDGLLDDPADIFNAMSQAEQDKTFTAAGAQAIRDGADMNQVVNARRGANGLTPAGARITAEEATILRGGRESGRLTPVDVFGKPALVTTEGTTVRGNFGRPRRGGATRRRAGQRIRSTTSVRLMPESIYAEAGGDRDEAIRLLRLHGYLRPEVRAAAPRPAVSPPAARSVAPARPVTTPPPATPATGSRRVAGQDRIDEISKASVEIMHATNRGAGFLPYDSRLKAIAERQSFDALPGVASKTQVDAAVASGWIESWRGVAKDAAAVNQRLRFGEFEPGKGIYGNGIYTSVRRDTAEAFRHVDIRKRPPESELPPDSMLRIAIDPAARIVDYDELLKEYKAWVRTLPNRGKLAVSQTQMLPSEESGTGPTQLLGGDIARYATARGYDVIRIRNNGGKWADGAYNYRKGEERADQFNILNRSVMLIQEAGAP